MWCYPRNFFSQQFLIYLVIMLTHYRHGLLTGRNKNRIGPFFFPWTLNFFGKLASPSQMYIPPPSWILLQWHCLVTVLCKLGPWPWGTLLDSNPHLTMIFRHGKSKTGWPKSGLFLKVVRLSRWTHSRVNCIWYSSLPQYINWSLHAVPFFMLE